MKIKNIWDSPTLKEIPDLEYDIKNVRTLQKCDKQFQRIDSTVVFCPSSKSVETIITFKCQNE